MDDNDNSSYSGWGGSGLSLGSLGNYGLGGPLGGNPTEPGLSVGNQGDYSLGGDLGGYGGGSGGGWGNGSGGFPSGGGIKINQDDLYKSGNFSSLSGLFNSQKAYGLNTDYRQSLDSLFDGGKKLGLSLKNPNDFARSLAPQQYNPVSASIDQSVRSLPQIESNADKKEPGFFEKGGTGYEWGLRAPGTEEAKNFFDHETVDERNLRMGKVNDLLGSMANLLPGVTTAKGVASAINGYQKGQDISTLAGNFLSGFGGIPGAIGSAVQGNYGRAISQAVPGLNGTVAGLGVDALRGKNVTQPVAQLTGGMLGNRFGGPIGGFIGSRLGGGLARMYRGK
jgi:hypothetical protein